MTQTSPTIQNLREDLEKIDIEIARLMVERFRTVATLGGLKKLLKIEVRDLNREIALLNRVRKVAKSEGLNEDVFVKVFTHLIEESINLQQST